MLHPENEDIVDLVANLPKNGGMEEATHQLINETMRLVSSAAEEAMEHSIIKDASKQVVSFIGDIYREGFSMGIPQEKIDTYVNAYLAHVDSAVGSNFSSKE